MDAVSCNGDVIKVDSTIAYECIVCVTDSEIEFVETAKMSLLLLLLVVVGILL